MAIPARDTNKREHGRVSDPAIRLQIGSRTYRSVNWSLGGVLIDGYDGGLRTGALLSITEIGLGHGVMTPVKIKARVTRANADANILALHLLEIDQSAYAIMQKLLATKMLVIKARPPHGRAGLP